MLLAVVHSHNLLVNWKLVCGPEGPPTKVSFLLFNDYGPSAWFNTTGVPGGFPVNYYASMGRTIGCTSSSCTTWHQTVPSYGTVDPSLVYMPDIPLTPNPAYTSCKQSGGTNCGQPYQTITLKGRAHWPFDDCCPEYDGRTGYWSFAYHSSESDISTANCPTDVFNCPNPTTDACSVTSCRCNNFKFLLIQTDSVTKNTRIRVNVTNNCADSFYYAAFGLNDGLSLVSPSDGATYAGTNYNSWVVDVVDGSAAGSKTTPPIRWVRFVTTVGSGSGNAVFTNATGKGPSWEVFEFTVSGYDSSHLWTVQGHEGGKWDTFSNLDVSLCPCTGCDSTNTNGCPPGYSGPSCTDCDRSPPPGDYSWFCLSTSNPASPWQLVKVPISKINTAPYVAPGFVPSNGSGLHVDSQGYTINCDCSRVIYDCSPYSFCSGHGTCVPQNGTCICQTGYIGPDCQPPATTTPTSTTTAPSSTSVTDTSSSTTTPAPSPPCYNSGDYCSGHGICNANVCVCNDGFSGNACQDITTTTNHYCNEFSTCSNCTTQAAQFNLACTWCADVIGGGCVNSAACLNVISSCGATGISFVPEPCPDDCSGSKHGVCVNETCSALTASGKPIIRVNGVPACIDDSNTQQNDSLGTIDRPATNASFCLCRKGYKGNNCGAKSSGLGKALAISGGVIAAIVICGVIVILLVAFGAKKGVDFVMLHHQATADFQINPTHENRDQEHFSGIHQ